MTAITVTGTASKQLSGLHFVNSADGSPTELAVTRTLDGTNPTRWTAMVRVPPTGATWSLRVVGTDLDGNLSSPGSKDVVTVVSDPIRPDLTVDLTANVTNGDQLYLLSDGHDPAQHIANGKLTVNGTVTDGQSGVAGIMFAGMKQAVTGAPAKWNFTTAVSLKEGVLTPVTVTGLDVAGNASKPYQINVLMKSMIRKLDVSARWTKTGGLIVSGATDAAIKLPFGVVGVVPIEVVIVDAYWQEWYRHTFVADGVEYTPATGAFRLLVDTAGWLPSHFMVMVRTKAPVEFPHLTAMGRGVDFTIPWPR